VVVVGKGVVMITGGAGFVVVVAPPADVGGRDEEVV